MVNALSLRKWSALSFYNIELLVHTLSDNESYRDWCSTLNQTKHRWLVIRKTAEALVASASSTSVTPATIVLLMVHHWLVSLFLEKKKKEKKTLYLEKSLCCNLEISWGSDIINLPLAWSIVQWSASLMVFNLYDVYNNAWTTL